MTGLLLLFFFFFFMCVANSLQENCPTDTSLVHQADQLLLSLNGDQEMLVDMKLKVEEQEAKVAELETNLEEKRMELSHLRDNIQILQLAAESHELQLKQVESVLASQRKQLDEVHNSLHLIEDLVLEAQARSDQKEQEILKVYTQWLPQWAVTHLTYWQGIWRVALKEAVLGVGGYSRVYENKVLKHLNVLGEHFETCLHKAQKVLNKKIQAAWKLSRDYLDGPIKTLEPHVNQLESFLQPHALKLWQYYNKTLRYGIKQHLQLQRKIRKALQKNRYLVSIATKEVTWFLASALLILPLYGALLLFSSFFGAEKRSRLAKGATSHRREEVRQSRRIYR
eukprot:c24234_g12_i1 orf=113-1129(+)